MPPYFFRPASLRIFFSVPGLRSLAWKDVYKRQALACLDMMDFEGIEKVRQRVAQNGTLYQQLQQAMRCV